MRCVPVKLQVARIGPFGYAHGMARRSCKASKLSLQNWSRRFISRLLRRLQMSRFSTRSHLFYREEDSGKSAKRARTCTARQLPCRLRSRRLSRVDGIRPRIPSRSSGFTPR
eukprot:1820693-Pyramimonas_sp.AAC.1